MTFPFRWRLIPGALSLAVLFAATSSVYADGKQAAQSVASGAADRAYTIRVMQRLADPVLNAIAENRLHQDIPLRAWETKESIHHTSPLQAFGRTISGMSPWLSLGPDNSEEGKLRAHYIELVRQGIINGSDPKSPDYLFRDPITEHIVHICYFAYPLLIAEDELWTPLTDAQKTNVINAIKLHRQFKPWPNNWLLFSAILECTLWELTGECNQETIEYAVNQHQEWYLGDGTYGDGKEYHWDYYNSYVIQPLLLETLLVCKAKGHPLGQLLEKAAVRGARYAEVQEHMISPEGTFPVIGRSSTYRFAAFQHLGYFGFRFDWPKTLSPGATRAALTTVIRRMIEAPGTFDDKGWINGGVVGEQPEACDDYNTTGALYFTVTGLAHLGMPPDHPFWTEPAGEWFQQRVWSGEEIPNQHFIRK